MNGKKLLVILVVVVLLLIILALSKTVKINKSEVNNLINNTNIGTNNTSNNTEEIEPEKEDQSGIAIVPTMKDKITKDSSWCGTFQLVWNDMKNEIVKKDIVFKPQLDMVKNLNKEEFNEKMLSEDYYFKIYGLKNIELKNKIEEGIKEKFNQTSDILEDFDWSEDSLDNPDDVDTRRYFFYTMLYRKFEFLKEFDKLKNDKFGEKYNDVKYFGIDKNTNDSVGQQINVLYYNSKEDFAVIVNTKTNDEVIFCKNPKEKNFNEIYDNMNNESNKYKGSKKFKDVDEFKAPNLTFNEKKEYKELENKPFETADPVYKEAEIAKAIQSIKFSLDEKGGEVKSEAAIDMKMTATALIDPIKEEQPRYFYLNDAFAIFLREKGREQPYFAGSIDDITKFQ